MHSNPSTEQKVLTFTRINLNKNVVYVILIDPVKKGWRVDENVSGMCMFVKRCLKVTKIRGVT